MSGANKLTDAELFYWEHSGTPLNRIMARELLAHRRASQAATANWQDDPAADDRWCAGNDFALSRLCAVLKVDPDLVDWDGGDNSLQDEADALILRILNAQAAPAPSDTLREAARTLLDGAETGSLAELHHAVSDLFGVVDGSDQEDDLFEALLEGLRHTGTRAALSTPTEERQ